MSQQLSSEAQEELEVLRSIYGADFSERATAWKQGFCCVLAVRPLIHGTDIHAHVDLKVTLASTYPRSKPTVALERVRGLSPAEARELLVALQALAAEKVGAVMIHDLASAAESYLEVHNRKPQTFYEIMNSRKSREHEALKSLRESGPHADDADLSERGDERSLAAAVPEAPLEAAPEVAGATEKAWLMSFIQQGQTGDSDSSDESDGEAPVAAEPEKRPSISPRDAVPASRYEAEFVEIELLGKGGSGQVWKVRNKLDRRIYAVKKIKLDAALSVNKKIRREVTTISRLAHGGIVRYNGAWVEEVRGSGNEGDQSSDGSSPTLTLASDTRIADGTVVAANASSSGNLIKDIWSTGDDLSISCAVSFCRGEEDEEEDEDDAAAGPAGIAAARLRLPSFPEPAAAGVERKLYIQMEFCPTTLRHVIDNSELHRRPREVCGLLRQMLEALAYIHSRGVIHRDLKPANIFLDANGDIKIGDFGLATSGHRRDASADDVDGTAGEDAEESLTTGVGTAHYRAPEQGLRNRSYDEKADLYSVGVILFEMARPPFSTGMERAVALRALRERGAEGLLPAEQQAVEQDSIAKLVSNLTSANPAKRLSAVEVLKSPLLPARIDTDAIKALTSALGRSSNEPVASQLISSLFDRGKSGPSPDPGAGSRELDGVAYDLSSVKGSLLLLAPRVIGSETRYQSSDAAPAGSKGRAQPRRPAAFQQEVVTSPLLLLNSLTALCTEVFERFGAVKFSEPSLLAPRTATSSSSSSGSLECELMDRFGEVLALPSDLTTGFARYCGLVRMSSCRRYFFDRTFTCGAAAGESSRGHPRVRFEGVFDVVSSDALAAESEVLAAAALLLKELAPSLPPTVIRLTDRRLLECIVSICSLSLGGSTGREVDAEIIRQTLSLCSDSSSSRVADLARLLSDAGADPQLQKPLLPFMLILAQQQSRPAGRPAPTPLVTLVDIESEFYKCAPVVAVQRQLAGAAGDVLEKRDLRRLRGVLRTFNEAVTALKAGLGLGLGAPGAAAILDLGLDADRSQVSPLAGSGLYFTVEAYQVISGGERRRYKGSSGVIAEGGHFEHLAGGAGSAVALRLHMDALLAQVLKAQGRDSKRRRSAPAPAAAPSGLRCLRGRCADALVFSSSTARRAAAAALLRSEGLAVIEGAHQLQCVQPLQPCSAEEAEQLCHQLGVPYLVLLDSCGAETAELGATVELRTFVTSSGRRAGSRSLALGDVAAEVSRSSSRLAGGAEEGTRGAAEGVEAAVDSRRSSAVSPTSGSSAPPPPPIHTASRFVLIDSVGRPLAKDKKTLLQKEKLLRDFKIQQFISALRDAPLVVAVELPFLLVRKALTLLAEVAATGGACTPELEAFASRHVASRKALRAMLQEVAACPGDSTTMMVYSLLDERMDCMIGCDGASAGIFLAHL